MEGLLVVVSGPSAVGKNTVLARFLKSHPPARYSISATTRKARRGEVDGRNYYFYEEADFLKLREQGELLEWAQVYDAYYGTPRGPIEEGLQDGEVIVMDLDTQGAMAVKKNMPSCVTVFLLPPSLKILAHRLSCRGTECKAAMVKRLAAAKAELQAAQDYDYLIVNDDLDKAVAELATIVEAEQLKTTRRSCLLSILAEGGSISNVK